MNGGNPYKLSFSKLNESFRTGLVSPAQSTSVTPITPMTPLTTPRTPAQILLSRNELRAKRSVSIEPYEEEKQQQLALEIFTNFVDSVEGSLKEIAQRECDGERVIGPGIVRMCHDLAERVEELAEEVKEKGVVDDLMLHEHEGDDVVIHEAKAQDEPGAVSSGTIYSILTDVAASLRSISQEEAQELAEVSLHVATMAVWTLRMVQSNMSRMLNSSQARANHVSSRSAHKDHMNGDVLSSGRSLRVTWSNDDDITVVSDNRSNGHANRGLGPLVEIMAEEEKKDENYNSMNMNEVVITHVAHDSSTPPKEFSTKYAPQLATIPSSPSRSPQPLINDRSSSRCRVLWPPVLPAIQQASHHCINQAQQHPLSAAAIGLVCGPAAITTAVIMGPPVLITDWAVQSSYNAMSGTPFIETVEKAAANAVQLTKLAIICSKMAIKQGMAVGERQIQRRGGINKICCDVVDGTVDRVMHPVKTAGMAWDGLFWMGSMFGDAVGFVGEVIGAGGERVDIQ
ncbi:hypothetical protein ACHAXN_006816 [Cyclotella atomus]